MSKAFKQAHAIHKSGQSLEAAKVLREALRRDPTHAPSFHLLGVIEARQKRFDIALKCFDAALAINPDYPPYLMDRANVVASLGNPAEAIAAYDRVLIADPKLPEAWSNRGQALRLLNRRDEAVESLRKALALRPSFVDAQGFLADTLSTMGRLDEAITEYTRALALNPLHIPALLSRGKCFLSKERYGEAEADFRKIIDMLPEHVEAQGGLACALIELDKPQAALVAADRAVALEPKSWEWHMYRGKALLGLDRPQEALHEFELLRDLGGAPQNYFILMGSAYLDLNQMDKALELYDQGARIDPSLPAWYYNRGVAFARLRRYEEAVIAYEEAIARDPTHAISHWNCSLSMLIQGNPRGWELYEWRWKLPSGGPDPKSQPTGPRWNGHEEIRGKRILLTAEQGLGDTLMFCRFAPLVTAMGATVDLAVHAGLVRTLQTLDNINDVIDRTKPIKMDRYSFYCPLMSLPRILKMSFDDIPFGDQAYLRARPEWTSQWSGILADATQNSGRPRVGLMWSGRRVKTLGVRSVTLPTLLDVLDPRFDFISLQKDLPKEDAELLERSGIFHFGAQQTDFADAAAMIELCDVVVTIDTSIAHLAGALGKETWIMLQYDAEWRWLENRTDSPWYPKVRLFRQPTHGDWESVIAEIKRELIAKF